MANGTSIEDLQKRLTGGGSSSSSSSPPASTTASSTTSNGSVSAVKEKPKPAEVQVQVPEELVGIQAYIRWERAGKQQYSQEKQAQEYVEAKRELEEELRRGTSVGELRKRLTGSEKPPPPPPTAVPVVQVPVRPSGGERIQRKQWNADELINRYDRQGGEQGGGAGAAATAGTGTAVEGGAEGDAEPLMLAAQVMASAGLGGVTLQKVFKLGKNKLLVRGREGVREGGREGGSEGGRE